MSAELIRKTVRAMVEGMIPLNSAWCTVKSVDSNKRTCDVYLDGDKDLVIEEILLGFDKSGVIVKPKVNSDVLVMFVNNTKTIGAVVMVEKTDSVEIMGTNFGGIPKINPLKTELQKLDAKITTVKTAAGSAIGTLSGIIDSGTSGTAYNAAVAALPTQDLTQLENEKVKMGNGL
jgi:hypothetical protein